MTRSIGQWEVAAAEGEPIEFHIGGSDFLAIPEAPFGILAELMAGVRNGQVRINLSDNFVRAVLLDDEQRERWDAVVRNPDYPVPVDTVQSLVDALWDAYTGRPSLPPSGSPDGRPTTTDTSTDSAPEAQPTPGA